MLSKLWPARTAKKIDGPVSDLDAIIAEPVNFRFKGKIHQLKPVDMQTFLKFTSAHSSLMRAAQDPEVKLSAEDLAQKYHQVISSLCNTITVKDIMDMEQVQIAALFQLVMDVVTGQVDDGDGKKKRMKIQGLYSSVQPSSLPNVPSAGDGPAKQH